MLSSNAAVRLLKLVVVVFAAVALLAPAGAAVSGTATITGGNTGITAGWRGSVAGSEFLAKCLASQATGASAVPASNGVGAWVVDMGALKSGFVYTSSTTPVSTVGPVVPDPSRVVFPSGSFQLHNYDFDLYFVSAQCTQVGSAVTQDAAETGLITTPARYVVILLAFNATGKTAVDVTYSTP